MEITFGRMNCLCIFKHHMVMMMTHKEMEVHPLAFLTSPLAGGVVSPIHVGESPQFPL